MSNTLDPIIRRIERRGAAKPSRIAVAVHPKTGKALPDDSLLSLARSLLNDIIWYEVTVDESLRVDNETAPIEVFLTNERTNLAYRIRLKAKREQARAIVEALHHNEMTPLQVLFRAVGAYTERLLERPDNLGPESVVERIALSGPVWQAELERFIADRFHLDAEIIFETGHPVIDTDIKLRVENIKVSPMDAPHASFPITVSVVLARALARTSDQLPRTKEDRELLISDVIIKTFRDRLTLYNYWFEPNRVNSELTKSLTEALARFAYGLKRLSIDPIVPPVASEEQIYDDVSWTGRLARSIPFHIATKIRMTPEGAGIYHARGLPNRRDWIKKEVQAALQAAMYGRDFINLTADAEGTVRAKVEEVLKTQASTIGHDVETFVAKAAIPEQIWFSATTVKVGRRTYNTKNDLVPAEFEIDLVVELATLERLEPLIQAHRRSRPNDLENGANEAIRSAIVESATRAAEREMSQIEPSRYFSEYERWELPINEGDQPDRQNYVRNQLIRAIRSELKLDFDIAACRVNLRRVDSRVQDIIKRLQGIGDITVAVPVEPQDSRGSHEAIQVTIIFNIGDLLPQHLAKVIQRGDAALNKDLLSEDLRNWSREALGERKREELYGLASRQRDNRFIRQEVETYVDNLMGQHHGVTVRIKSTDFKYSKIDEVYRGVEEITTEERLAHLQRIRTAIDEIGKENDDGARVKFLRDRREILHKKINDNERKTETDFDNLAQHEKELERINGELSKTHKIIAQKPMSQLPHLSGTAKPADEAEQKPIRDVTDPSL